MKEFKIKEFIKESLKKDPTKLDLLCTSIGNGGAELVEGFKIGKEGAELVAEELRTNKELLTLDLSNTYIDPEEAEIIAEALETNKTLKTLKLNNEAEIIVKALEKNSTLERLELLNYRPVFERPVAIAKMLKVNTALKKLIVAKDYFGSEGIKIIAEALMTNASLEELAFVEIMIGPDGAKALAEMLAVNGALKTLSVIRDRLGFLGTDSVKVITDVLQTKNSSLTALDFSRNNIDIEVSESIGNMLAQNRTLTSIDLSACKMRYNGMVHIANGLKTNKTLLTLKLAGSEICPDGAKCIVKALKNHPTLEELDLSHNYIGAEGAQQGVKAIAKMLEATTTMRKLNIGRNNFEPDAVKIIFDAMASNSTVETLDFTGNNAGGLESGTSIANMLVQNRSLKWLRLSACSISYNGAVLIAEGLSENQYLVKLYLSWNAIGNSGIEAIAQKLKRNTSLRILDVSRCGLKLNEAKTTFLELLEQNTVLEELKFWTVPELESVSVNAPDFLTPITEKLEKNAKMNAEVQAEILNKKNHFPARRLKIGFWQKTKENEQNENMPLSDVKFGYQ